MRTFTKAEYVIAMAEDILNQRAAYEELKPGHKVALGAAALAGAGAVGHHMGYASGHAAGGGGILGHLISATGGAGVGAGLAKLHDKIKNDPAVGQLWGHFKKKVGLE